MMCFTMIYGHLIYCVLSNWHSLGAHAVRCAVVCLRFLQFVGAKFRLAVATSRACWICHWMRTAIVSLSSESVSIRNVWSIRLISDRVTLYAEFLPTKQRAKCVVLLDVSATIRIQFSRTKIDLYFSCMNCSASGLLVHVLRLHWL